VVNLILYLFYEDYIQAEATSSSPIDKYNNILNNTKEYKLMREKTRQ